MRQQLPSLVTRPALPCATVDPDTFFPDRGDNAGVEAARGVCRSGCPAFDGCLEYVLARPGLLGVWAATTPDERGAIRRRGARAREAS